MVTITRCLRVSMETFAATAFFTTFSSSRTHPEIGCYMYHLTISTSLDVLVVVNIKSSWWYFRSVLLQPSEAPGEHGLREFTSEGSHQSAASQTDSHLAKSHHLWVQGKTPFFQDKCILVPWHILGKSVSQNKWTKNQDFEMGPSVKFILSYTGYISG